MAKLSKSERLKRYQERIKFATRYREKEGYESTWLRLIDLYKGKHFDGQGSDDDRIAINIAFATINVIYPSITVNHPQITVVANKPEDEAAALTAEGVVNYWWRHYDFRDPFRQASKDFLLLGHGWVKVGWRYKTEQQMLSEDEIVEEVGNLMLEADEFASANPEFAHELPTDDEILANAPETRQTVVEDRPFVERISPFDMFVDPEATDMDDAKWIAQRIVRTLEEAKDDKRYKQSVRNKLEGSAGIRSDLLGEKDRKKRSSDAERVVIWEFYDLVEDTMAVFADGGKDYLIGPIQNPYPFPCPYEMIANYSVTDEFYPIGDLENIEVPQQELNKTRTQMMRHRKKYARKYLYRSGAFDPKGREALESDLDNVAIEVIDDNTPLGDVVAPVPITQLSADMYNYSDIIRQDMNIVSGVSEYQQGLMPSGRRTATEASMIQDGTNARVSDKLGTIEVSISRIARKVLQVAQEFMTEDQVARVTGQDGAQSWVQFSWEAIRGEFDFAVEGGSTQPVDEQGRRQKALAMLQSLGPFVGQIIDPVQFVKFIMQEGFDIKDPDKYLMGPPPMDPMQEPPPDGMEEPMPPGMDPGMGPMPQGPMGEGVDAPQLTPEDLMMMQQMGGM